MTPGRQMVYDYLSLPQSIQRRIAIDLQLLNKKEIELGTIDMATIVFRRANADNKLEQLREKLQEERMVTSTPLPYEFDLLYDVKTREELYRILKGEPHRTSASKEELIELMEEMNIPFPEGYMKPDPPPKDDIKYTNKELLKALDESVKLQSHYADLLNMYDGGKRMSFNSGEKWIERLRTINKEGK